MCKFSEYRIGLFCFPRNTTSKSIEVSPNILQFKDELRMETEQSSSNATGSCEYVSSKGVQCGKSVAVNSLFCAEHTNQPSIDLEIYKSIHARFHHYVNASWTRTSFFFLVEAGFFTVFTGILVSTTNKASLYLTSINFVIGSVGLAIGCLWYFSSKINRKFVNLWRGQVIKIDKAVDKRQHHTVVEEQFQTSVSALELIQFLCMIFIAGWLVSLGVLIWLTLAH